MYDTQSSQSDTNNHIYNGQKSLNSGTLSSLRLCDWMHTNTMFSKQVGKSLNFVPNKVASECVSWLRQHFTVV